MDKYKNYYGVLGLNRLATSKEIKLAYYKLSKEYHPDVNPEQDDSLFKEIVEAYKTLSKQESKKDYDDKSKYGATYEEKNEYLDYEFSNDAKNYDKKTYEDWKKREQLNIIINVDENFNGVVEYERYVMCKSCEGCGKDNTSKIAIKDENGNIIKYFDAIDGCDFCEGTGKWGDLDCVYCFGAGKINGKDCSTCKGEKRILGKQKLKGIKIKEGETEHRIDFMGHSSRDIPGRVGHLWIIKKATK